MVLKFTAEAALLRTGKRLKLVTTLKRAPGASITRTENIRLR